MPDLVGQNLVAGGQRMPLLTAGQPQILIGLGVQLLGQAAQPVLLREDSGGPELATPPRRVR